MERRKLGNSDLEVSSICMGCMGFGDAKAGQHSWTLDEEASRKVLRKGLEAGINFFDTAVGYQGGTGEKYVGRALKDFARRDEVVLATKFVPRSTEEIEEGVSGAAHVQNLLNRSLKNLGMDYVDLYIYHMWDYLTPIEEILDGLTRAVKAGKVRYIGISNCFAWQLCRANDLAEREGFEKFVSVQGHYNLIFREEEREMVPFCRQENIALTPYSPLAGGRLSKHPGETSKRLREDSYARLKYDGSAQQDARILERVAELADGHGVSMTQIALSWLKDRVTAPVVGMTRPEQVADAVQAADLMLSAEECAYLEECYVPHALVGVMAQNTASAAREKHVWEISKK